MGCGFFGGGVFFVVFLLCVFEGWYFFVFCLLLFCEGVCGGCFIVCFYLVFVVFIVVILKDYTFLVYTVVKVKDMIFAQMTQTRNPYDFGFV